jgi:60 kDa SS-A/Ro ribonucleoprotein
MAIGGGTDCSLPLVAANQKHAKRKFAGIVLDSDNESWVGTGRHGSTGVMTAWEAFVANQRRLNEPQSTSSRFGFCLKLLSQTVSPCPHATAINVDSVLFRQGAMRLRKTRPRTGLVPVEP